MNQEESTHWQLQWQVNIIGNVLPFQRIQLSCNSYPIEVMMRQLMHARNSGNLYSLKGDGVTTHWWRMATLRQNYTSMLSVLPIPTDHHYNLTTPTMQSSKQYTSLVKTKQFLLFRQGAWRQRVTNPSRISLLILVTELKFSRQPAPRWTPTPMPS